jgi:hypothetical protein
MVAYFGCNRIFTSLINGLCPFRLVYFLGIFDYEQHRNSTSSQKE